MLLVPINDWSKFRNIFSEEGIKKHVVYEPEIKKSKEAGNFELVIGEFHGLCEDGLKIEKRSGRDSERTLN